MGERESSPPALGCRSPSPSIARASGIDPPYVGQSSHGTTSQTHATCPRYPLSPHRSPLIPAAVQDVAQPRAAPGAVHDGAVQRVDTANLFEARAHRVPPVARALQRAEDLGAAESVSRGPALRGSSSTSTAPVTVTQWVSASRMEVSLWLRS